MKPLDQQRAESEWHRRYGIDRLLHEVEREAEIGSEAYERAQVAAGRGTEEIDRARP